MLTATLSAVCHPEWPSSVQFVFYYLSIVTLSFESMKLMNKWLNEYMDRQTNIYVDMYMWVRTHVHMCVCMMFQKVGPHYRSWHPIRQLTDVATEGTNNQNMLMDSWQIWKVLKLMHTYVERTDGYANVVQVLVQQKSNCHSTRQ